MIPIQLHVECCVAGLISTYEISSSFFMFLAHFACGLVKRLKSTGPLNIPGLAASCLIGFGTSKKSREEGSLGETFRIVEFVPSRTWTKKQCRGCEHPLLSMLIVFTKTEEANDSEVQLYFTTIVKS